MKKLVVAMFLLLCFATSAFAAHKNVALVIRERTGDKNAPEYVNTCMSGLKMAKHRYVRSLSVKLYEVKKHNNSVRETLEEASKWADLVIIPTNVTDDLASVRRNYPKVNYVAFGDKPVDGVRNVNFRNEEVGFLAGILAVNILQKEKDPRIKSSSKIGCILGPDIMAIRQMKYGFNTAVWYVDKNIKPLFEQVQDFNDRAAVAAAARRLHAQGVDVIFTAAGDAGLGASEIAEKEGFWTIGVDTEVERIYPQGTLASVVKRIDYVIDRIIDVYMQGKLLQYDTASIGARDEVIGISLWTREAKNNVPLSIRKKVAQMEDKLITGLLVLPKYKE